MTTTSLVLLIRSLLLEGWREHAGNSRWKEEGRVKNRVRERGGLRGQHDPTSMAKTYFWSFSCRKTKTSDRSKAWTSAGTTDRGTVVVVG